MIPLDINGKRQNVDLPGETPLLSVQSFVAELAATAGRDQKDFCWR